MPINNGRHLSGKTHLHLMYTFRFTIRSNRTVQAISDAAFMRKAASDNAYSSAGRTGNVLTVTSYRTNRSFPEKRVWLFACPPRFPKTAYVRRRFPTESYSGNALSGNVAGRRSSRSYRKKTGRVSQPVHLRIAFRRSIKYLPSQFLLLELAGGYR